MVQLIKKCSNADKDKIMEYIGDEFGKCLYIYLNIERYGVNEVFLKTWISTDDRNEVNAVVIKYHTGMHVFSKESNCNICEIAELLAKEEANMICGTKNLIEMLEPFFENNQSAYGHVKLATDFKEKKGHGIERATLVDVRGMSKMLCRDYGIGASYTVEEMEKQMKERLADGYGRNYIMRDRGWIIGQVGTGTEMNAVAVVSYVIVDEACRGKGLATKLLYKLCGDLALENKKCFLVCYNPIADLCYENRGIDQEKIFIDREFLFTLNDKTCVESG